MRRKVVNPNLRPWSTAELDILCERFGTSSAAELAAVLNRSKHAVYCRANLMGLKKSPLWTNSENTRLRFLWGSGMTVEEIAKDLRRRPMAVYLRARLLGLRVGCPNGWEYFYKAAERTGYETSQLRRILSWAGVYLHRGLSRNTGTKRHHHYVDPDRVDDAIGRWLDTESVLSAARRYGVCDQGLRRWLMKTGMTPKRRKAGKMWRVTELEVRRALEAWKKGHSAMVAAGLRDADGRFLVDGRRAMLNG